MKPCFLLLDPANVITFNGSGYRCYTLPQYDSPFVEEETITMFIRDTSISGTLMTGQQDGYQFSLYITNRKLHYEASLDGAVFASVSTASNVDAGTLQISRDDNTVVISRIDNSSMILATGSITVQEFGLVRFTDICVGGGLINNLIYSDTLQNVYYNLHYLSASGAVFEERTRAGRVNFADPNALIGLPGNLEDNTNIQLLFRTSQPNAILLQSEVSNDYFHISINNSQLHATVVVGDQTRTSHCSNLNITDSRWYTLIVEPQIGTDTGSSVSISLSIFGSTIADRCDLQASIINNFRSAPVWVGGGAEGVEGLMGCLELMINFRSLNLEVTINDATIRNDDDCGSCDIMPSPCLNEGTCVPLNNYEFNCSCADPYFGDTCGECCYYSNIAVA